MNRTVVGVLLLLVLLAGGIGSAAGLTRQSQSLANQLDFATRLAASADLQESQAVTEKVRDRWERILPVYAILTSHNPLDAISLNFSRLELYAQAGDSAGFALTCRELAELFRALGEAQKPKWWNIL